MPAEPVREHLERVRKAGMPARATAVRLGLPSTAFEYLLWGDQNNGPGELVRRETAEAVLAYWPTLGDFPDGARIDPTGTRRRVHALETLGFSQKFIAGRVGIQNTNFGRAMVANRVTARLARAVAAQYDLLWNKQPEDFEVKRWVADRTRRLAVRQGWASPLAWDDDTIDDPAAVPQVDAPQAGFTEGDDVVNRFLMGEAVVLGREARRAVICHLMEWSTETTAEIGARLEMDAEAVYQAWRRMRQEARKAGRPVPWRRVYVPLSDMNLTKDDLRSAA
ncbi:hypothetical protein ACFVG1_12825 [Streptomyces bacillaris]|uniref:hypothetical protein n=1 Tax=Streptomyces bacillaris TaxID=68179 RepID=UPI0035D5EFE7